MATRVILTNPSRSTRRLPSTSESGDLLLSRNMYQQLSSLIQNRKLSTLYASGSLSGEYMRLLDELNNIYLKQTDPVLNAGIVLADNIEALDAYLGSLGETNEYQYGKDIQDIPVWVGVTAQEPTRNVVDGLNNVVLTADNIVHSTGEI